MNDLKNILIVNHLYKRYGNNPNYAIKDINFYCKENEIVGILGRNGAGKSTTIKCITGYLPFEKGEVWINGYEIKQEPEKAKKNFGYVADNRATFERMTGMEYLNFMGDIYNVSYELRKVRIEEFQLTFDLGDSIYNLISSYSHGMKQKIALMGSLIHYPPLWILDEPLTGLDPLIAHALLNYMDKYKKKKKTVLFSSHNLNVVEKICDRVLIIDKGDLVEEIKMNEFKETNLEKYFIEKYGE